MFRYSTSAYGKDAAMSADRERSGDACRFYCFYTIFLLCGWSLIEHTAILFDQIGFFNKKKKEKWKRRENYAKNEANKLQQDKLETLLHPSIKTKLNIILFVVVVVLLVLLLVLLFSVELVFCSFAYDKTYIYIYNNIHCHTFFCLCDPMHTSPTTPTWNGFIRTANFSNGNPITHSPFKYTFFFLFFVFVRSFVRYCHSLIPIYTVYRTYLYRWLYRYR